MEALLQTLTTGIYTETALAVSCRICSSLPHSQTDPFVRPLQLYNSVLSTNTLPGHSFIAGLDALLARAPRNGLRRGEIVELQGPPSSGKSQLLYFLAMTAILPHDMIIPNGAEGIKVGLGGKGQLVVWLDCTGRFQVQRVATMLHAHLVGQIGEDINLLASGGVEDIVRQCLKRLIVFQPTSTLRLAATLLNLPAWHRSSGLEEEIAYVLIDGMGNFTASDAAGASERKQQSVSSPSTVPPIHHVLSSLAYVRSHLSPIIFLTTPGLQLESASYSKSSEGYPFFAPALPQPFPRIDTHPSTTHLTLDPEDHLLPPLLPSSNSPTVSLSYHITLYPPEQQMQPAGLTLAEVLERRDGRRVEEADFTAILRVPGGAELGSWNYAVRSAGLDMS